VIRWHSYHYHRWFLLASPFTENCCRERTYFLLLEALQHVGTHGTVVKKNITGHGPRYPLKGESSGVYRPLKQTAFFSYASFLVLRKSTTVGLLFVADISMDVVQLVVKIVCVFFERATLIVVVVLHISTLRNCIAVSTETHAIQRP